MSLLAVELFSEVCGGKSGRPRFLEAGDSVACSAEARKRETAAAEKRPSKGRGPEVAELK